MSIWINTQGAIEAEWMFRLGGVSPVAGVGSSTSVVNNGHYISENQEILQELRELRKSADNAWNLRVLEEAMRKRR